jgi:hypothetical protein
MDAGTLRDRYAELYSPETFMRFYQGLAQELFLLANPSRAIPVSPVPLVLDAGFQEQFSRLVSALWEAIADLRYREFSAREIPDRLTRPGGAGPEPIPFDPARSIGCIDLHLDGDGLRMIEFMVLPPGMSGIYPGLLARYGEYLQDRVPGCEVSCFSAGWDRARCEEVFLDNLLAGAEPERVAIIDWEPETQITYGEFRYTLHLLKERRQIPGLIADPREVETDGSRVRVRGQRVDRILNRLTLLDWNERCREIPAYTRLLWEVPDCFVYHPYLWYLGDKSSLVLLADPDALGSLNVSEGNRALLRETIPPTFHLSLFRRPDGSGWDTERLCQRMGTPSGTVLKPVSSHASKGIFFGPTDLATREELERALREIGPEAYVAMKLVPPPEIVVPRGQGCLETWKCDLRIFVLNGQYVFPGGRVYLGHYTNQVPCRAFAPLFFA